MTQNARRTRDSIKAMALLVLGAAFVLAPLPSPPPIYQHGATAHPLPDKAITTETFHLDQALDNLTLRLQSNLSSGWVEVKVLEDDSSASFGLKDRHSSSVTFGFGKPFARGEHRLQITQMPGTEGTWRMQITQKPPITTTQRLLAAMLLASVSSLAWWGWTSRRPATQPAQVAGAAGIARLFGFALFLLLLYPAIHETGHNLALSAFGACDWSRTDFIGMSGTPHSGRAQGVDLQPWQTSIVSLGGPLLPTLVGFVLFALWKYCRRISHSPLWESMLLWTTALLLLPQLTYPLLVTGIVQDGDYSGYIDNFPGPAWAGNLLLLVLAVVCAFLLVRIARRLLTLGEYLIHFSAARPAAAS